MSKKAEFFTQSPEDTADVFAGILRKLGEADFVRMFGPLPEGFTLFDDEAKLATIEGVATYRITVEQIDAA